MSSTWTLFQQNWQLLQLTQPPDGRPPQQTAEHFLWNLLNRFDPAETQKRLGACFPVVDRVNQGREFRQQCFKWLEVLKRQGDLPAHCVVRRSVLDECQGSWRFHRLLLDISMMVLRREFSRLQEGQGVAFDQDALVTSWWRSGLSADEKHKLFRQCQVSVVAMQRRFQRNQEEIHEIEEKLSSFTLQLQERQTKLKETIERHQQLLDAETSTDPKEMENNRIRKLCDSVKRLNEMQDQMLNVFTDPEIQEYMKILSQPPPKLRINDSSQLLLNGQHILRSLKLPRSLANHKFDMPMVDKHGNLDLAAYLTVFRLLLTEYAKELEQVPVHELTDHHHDLKLWYENNEHVEMQLNEIKNQIEAKFQELQKDILAASPDLPRTGNYPLPFMAPNFRLPSVNFSLIRKANLSGKPITPLKPLPSTPELLAQLRNVSQKTPTPVSTHLSPTSRVGLQENEPPLVQTSSIHDLKSKLSTLRRPPLPTKSVPQTPHRPITSAMHLLMNESPNLVESPLAPSRSSHLPIPILKHSVNMSTQEIGHEDSVDLLALEDPDWSMIL